MPCLHLWLTHMPLARVQSPHPPISSCQGNRVSWHREWEPTFHGSARAAFLRRDNWVSRFIPYEGSAVLLSRFYFDTSFLTPDPASTFPSHGTSHRRADRPTFCLSLVWVVLVAPIFSVCSDFDHKGSSLWCDRGGGPGLHGRRGLSFLLSLMEY